MDSQLHVLIIPSWYFPPGTEEISGRMFLHLAQGLRASGVNARIFYADFSMKSPLFKKTSFEDEEGVPTWRSARWFPPKLNSILYQYWLQRCATELQKYMVIEGVPDIIHAQGYPAACICAELQNQLKIPFVYTERLSAFMTGKIPLFHIPFIESSVAKAAMITAVSPGLRNEMARFTENQIQIIPNFYDRGIFYPNTQIKKNKVFTFVSIGEPAHIKGLDILLEAFAVLKQKLNQTTFQLVLIDRIPEEKNLKRLAHSLAIDDQITWTGLISQNEIADILHQSHAFVSASRVETFGKAIIEALACGLPVVATRTPGAESIMISPQLGIMVPVGDVSALSEAMENIYLSVATFDPKLISLDVEKRFSTSVVISQWIELYQDLC